MKKIGVIGVAGGWSTQKLISAIEAKTGSCLLIKMEDVYYNSEKQSCYYMGQNLLELDALVVKKIGSRYDINLIERLQMLIFLKKKGIRIFSDPESILRSYDRLSNTLTLMSANIPMPPTIITENIDLALDAITSFGKCILKPLYTSKAKGMIKLEADEKRLHFKVKAFKEDNQVIYVQKLIDLPGYDLGVTFLGNKYLTSYGRVLEENAWSTISTGGTQYVAKDPSPEVIDIAYKAQELFGLDFSCVDVIEYEQGPMVLEVSAFNGFVGISVARKIDAAAQYVDFVLKTLESQAGVLDTHA